MDIELLAERFCPSYLQTDSPVIPAYVTSLTQYQATNVTPKNIHVALRYVFDNFFNLDQYSINHFKKES